MCWVTELEQNWLRTSHKDKHKRSKYCMEWLDRHNVMYFTSNNGIHIYFDWYYKGETVTVNIWPTTCKMRIDNRSINGTSLIIQELLTLIEG
jgi:hypothetical protein